MSDDKHHNDPIERLFREKADEYDISYREDDWLNLEKKLDARDMQRRYRRRLRWLAAASFLILSLIGYYTVQNHNKINEITDQLNQNEVTREDEQARNGREPSVEQETITDEMQQDRESAGDIEIAEQNNRENTAGRLSPEDADSEISSAGSEDRTDHFINERIAEAQQIIQRKQVEAVRFEAAEHLNLPMKIDWFQPYWLAGQHFDEDNEGPPYEPESRALALLDDGFQFPQDPSSISRFAVGFVVSPDLSTVGSVSNFYDPGFKGGIMAEYSLNRTFSLMSGITVSNVKYKAAGEVYDPPRYWNSGIMPDETTAVCMILDIPLNLKANVKNFERSRIFATAGISSYIMLNEEYSFSYDGDSSGLQTSWEDRTGTRHWMSNAGFSIGIEWDLSPNWTFRAEPHLKIPLKGVGWGDVKLYSMGSFLSINYRFSGSRR